MPRSPRLPCSVEECSNPSCSLGLCFKHYRRWQRRGTTEPLPKPTGCLVDACEGKHRSKGYCQYHYDRWLSTGSPDAPPERPTECKHVGCGKPVVGWQMCEGHYREWREMVRQERCQIEGCRNKLRARGWCELHYSRWKEHGSADWMPHVTTSYKGVHDTIKRKRGRATTQLCVDCGQRADEWSYDHADPSEMRDPETGFGYSLDPSHYDPRCRPCHRAVDNNRKRFIVVQLAQETMALGDTA